MSTHFRLPELDISQIAFTAGSSSVMGAYRKLRLKESLNRVPRVLSYTFLRHSVGTGKREPWEQGWESPFSLLLILRLSTPALKGIKGVGVKTS